MACLCNVLISLSSNFNALLYIVCLLSLSLYMPKTGHDKFELRYSITFYLT